MKEARVITAIIKNSRVKNRMSLGIKSQVKREVNIRKRGRVRRERMLAVVS
jgi:hypothetical protein